MAVDQHIPSPADVAAIISKNVDVEPATEPEIVDAPADAPVENAPVDDAPVADVSTPEAEIVNTAKAMLTTLNKFDQATYDNAISALSDLIVVEANEMKAGSDERGSIKELLHAVKHLFHWYEGEAAAGEVANANPAIVDDEPTDIYLAAEGDAVACDKCGEIGKLCKCDKAADADVDAMPAAEKSVTLDFDADSIASIVEKAVSSAKDAVAVEIEALKAAASAADEKANRLQDELATALTKAANGGPKRAAVEPAKSQSVDSLLIKAAEYKAKASSTLDQTLAKGYRALADDLEKQAAKAGK